MVMSVVVGLQCMTISSLDSFQIMRRSRQLIHPLLSYEGFSFMFVCIWLIYLLKRFVFVRLVSYIIKISSTYLVYKVMFFVSRSCFLCISSRCHRKISAIVLEFGEPIDTPFSG